MPWCTTCEKNWTPTSLQASGACPNCGKELELPDRPETPTPSYRPPWHFWLGVGGATLYLVWRAIDGLSSFF